MTNENDKSPKMNMDYLAKSSPQKMVILTNSNKNLKDLRQQKSRQNSQESLRGTNITNAAMDEASL